MLHKLNPICIVYSFLSSMVSLSVSFMISLTFTFSLEFWTIAMISSTADGIHQNWNLCIDHWESNSEIKKVITLQDFRNHFMRNKMFKIWITWKRNTCSKVGSNKGAEKLINIHRFRFWWFTDSVVAIFSFWNKFYLEHDILIRLNKIIYFGWQTD